MRSFLKYLFVLASLLLLLSGCGNGAPQLYDEHTGNYLCRSTTVNIAQFVKYKWQCYGENILEHKLHNGTWVDVRE